LARDRAEQQAPELVDEAIRERLRKVPHADRGRFARLHAAPRSGAEVPDEDSCALVVLPPDGSHSAKSGDSAAVKAARDLLDRGARGRRHKRSMLVFLAAESARLEELRDGVRQLLAWVAIRKDKATRTLDSFQARQIDPSLERANQAVELRISET